MKKILLLFLLFFGCQSNEVRLNEDDERFAALYADILLVHADYERVIGNGGTFSKSDSLQMIFSLHRISPEQFNMHLNRYKGEPSLWLRVQDRAISMLTQRREPRLQNTRVQGDNLQSTNDQAN
ncbi:MAG: hypothetical protein ACUVRP_07010 [Chlorobiales bacterium]